MFSASKLIVAITALAAAPLASAASCYSAGGCKSCGSSSDVYNARAQLCNTNWDKSTTFDYGYVRVDLSGRFAEQQECWDGFQDIINSCYGHKNGGDYSYDYNGYSAHLDVNFCTPCN